MRLFARGQVNLATAGPRENVVLLSVSFRFSNFRKTCPGVWVFRAFKVHALHLIAPACPFFFYRRPLYFLYLPAKRRLAFARRRK